MAGNTNSGRRGRKSAGLMAPDLPAVKPSTLSEAQSAAWDHLAPHAVAMSTLRAVDVPAFLVLVDLVAIFHSKSVTKPTDVCRLAAEIGRYLSMFKIQPSAQGRVIRQTPGTEVAPPSKPQKPDVRDFAKRARARLADARVQ